MAYWPTHRIVKVRVERTEPNCAYPFRIISLDPNIPNICNGVFGRMDQFFDTGFFVADLSLVTLYRTQREGEKAEMEKIHEKYADLRRQLRKAQKAYKWGLKAVEDYKAFKQLNTPHCP